MSEKAAQSGVLTPAFWLAHSWPQIASHKPSEFQLNPLSSKGLNSVTWEALASCHCHEALVQRETQGSQDLSWFDSGNHVLFLCLNLCLRFWTGLIQVIVFYLCLSGSLSLMKIQRSLECSWFSLHIVQWGKHKLRIQNKPLPSEKLTWGSRVKMTEDFHWDHLNEDNRSWLNRGHKVIKRDKSIYPFISQHWLSVCCIQWDKEKMSIGSCAMMVTGFHCWTVYISFLILFFNFRGYIVDIFIHGVHEIHSNKV